MLERLARIARGVGRRLGRSLLPTPAPVPVRVPVVERGRRHPGRSLHASRVARFEFVLTLLIGAASAAGCTQRVELKRSPFITPLPEGQRQALAAPAETAAAEPADEDGNPPPTPDAIALQELRGSTTGLEVRPTVRMNGGSSGVADAAARVASLPRSAAARLSLARAYHHERIFDLAAEHYEAARDLDPHDPEIPRELARLWIDSGAPARALSVVDGVIRARPADADAWRLRGTALDRLGRHPEAMTAYRRALTLAPSRWDVLNDVGYNLILQERYAEAAQKFTEAMRLAPGEPLLANNLGLALALGGDADAALAAFRTAGDEALAWHNLGVVERLRGRSAEAAVAFARAARLTSASPRQAPHAKESPGVLQAARLEAGSLAMGAGIATRRASVPIPIASTAVTLAVGEETDTNSAPRGTP